MCQSQRLISISKIFQIQATFQILSAGNYKTKFVLMKGPLLLFTFQQILFEVNLNFTECFSRMMIGQILTSDSVMPCDQDVSQEFMSAVVMASLLMLEMTVLGALTMFVYLR